MAQHDNDARARADLEHQRAVAIAQQRIRQQLAEVAEMAPGHQITVESWPGRGDRYVAKASVANARPYLLITDDLNELYLELARPPRSQRPSRIRVSPELAPDRHGFRN